MIRMLLDKYYIWKTSRKMNRVFSRREDPYGYLTHPHELEKQRILLSSISDRRYVCAIEIGCAEGVMTRQLSKISDFLIGIDISPLAIERARNRCSDLKSVRFLNANVLELNFPKNMDLVVISEVLYYLEDWSLNGKFPLFLSRISENLAIGGRIVLLHSYNFELDYELKGRRRYRELMESFGLVLEKEFIKGDDPNKSRYLFSVLKKHKNNKEARHV